MFKLATLVIILFCCRSAAGIEVDRKIPPSIRLGVSNASVQNASGDYTRRRSYDFSYRQPAYKNFYLLSEVQIAPETKQRSKRLDVRQDLTQFLFLAAVAYPALFRLNFAAGPVLQRSVTTYDFDGESSSFTSTSTGMCLRIYLDYAVNSDFEITGSFQIVNRSQDQKIDRYYGISFAYNFPVGYSTKANTW